MTFPLAIHLRYTKLEPEARRQPQAAEDYKRFFMGRLKWIEPVLEKQPWLCGERFTAADVSVGYALRLASTTGLASALKPRVLAYLERLQARPAFRRAQAAEGSDANDGPVPMD